jgi:beta-hydroxylase
MIPPASIHAALQVKYILLALFLCAVLYIHLRGRVRYGFARQLTDHSTFLAPFNALIYLFSRVSPRPYVAPEAFPELAQLTANWEIIREEGLRLLGEGRVRASTGHNDLGFHSFFRNGWKRFYLKWYDDPLPSAREFCPRTVGLLAQAPSVNGAMFALLPPGGALGRHRDPYAGSLRYHLGLRTSNDDSCYIEVDGIRRSWRDGEVMMFDETFVHEARNDSNVNRLILFCDVERPLKGRLPTMLNRFVLHHILKATATQNTKGEPVGIANRIFAPVYQVRILFKRMKKWNRKVYYGFKYTATLAVLALIFLR